MKKSTKALVLLSGGMDSATVLAYTAKSYDVIGITFDYGQSHLKEIKCAMNLCQHFGAVFKQIKLDFSYFESALLGKSKIPTTEVKGIPPTYVPFRNVIFLSMACGLAESWKCNSIFYGANVIDYSGYPDCRPDFLAAFQVTAKIINKNIKIYAPLLFKSKSEIIKFGFQYDVPFEKTWSCYKGNEKACGVCPSCKFRLKGFQDLGMDDPLDYDV